ncbi:MAG: DNA repair protein RadC [Burkholderiaceae bacterium]|jgi:DNA repair protein RadC|nr:DNA repair protein RadC [Burkholderiaceae bacterium]
MSIKSLPAAARPREKLLAQGPQALADVELLALLLRTGLPGQGVLSLAETVLREFNGWAGLVHADAAALGRVKGLGPAKRAELTAVIEIARRALAQRLAEAPVFDAPAAVKQFVSLALGALPHEVFSVLFLDSQHRLLQHDEMFRGTLTQTSVYPREVVRRALELNAGAVILAHNHPSGAAEPSRADEFLTQSLKSALQLVDVRVLDHLVVGRGQVVSFAERGLL